jgi:hypothetical protein
VARLEGLRYRWGVAFVVRDTLEIEAPVALVWEVITDLPRYPE